MGSIPLLLGVFTHHALISELSDSPRARFGARQLPDDSSDGGKDNPKAAEASASDSSIPRRNKRDVNSSSFPRRFDSQSTVTIYF